MNRPDMRLGSKTRIGIRALFDIAFHCRGRQAQAKEIALRQRIPVRSLEEVLQDLRRAGLIDAQRGPRGGYALARLPEEIAVLQIVRALEGPAERRFSLDDHAPPRSGRPRRSRAADVAASSAPAWASASMESVVDVDVPALVWTDIAGRIAAVLDQTTLADFVARAESVGAKRVVAEPGMYFI